MKILLAVEGSKFSDAAIEFCGKLFSKDTEGEFRLISVSQPAFIAAEPFAVSAEYIAALDNQSKQHASKVLSEAERRLLALLPGAAGRLSTHLLVGSPERMIVEEAESWNADLIITGSHGHGFWKRAWLGSVSSAVAHHAPCSVMIVKS